MKTVMAFGTFDIFHEGHRSYLEQAKEYGECLVVVVARDETVLKIKNQRSENKENERLRAVRESGLADEVILGNIEDRYAAINKCRPDVIALGYDQRADIQELENKLAEYGLESKIVRLEPYHPEIYKSSKLKEG